MGSPKKFKTAVLGGTFDHFHKGHRKFLEHGLSISQKLIVGVTSDKYIRKFKIQNSQPKAGQPLAEKSFEKFSIRKKNVEDYLNQNAEDRYEIVTIDDIFGTTLSDVFIEVIVVSKETLKNAKIINIKRKERKLPPLKIIIQDPVFAKDGKPISSSRIRKGEIDREGKSYIDPDWLSKILYLPPQLRIELKNPLGKFFKKIKEFNSSNFLLTVGDETTKIFNKSSARPNIAIIDYRVARKKKYKSLKELGFLGNERVYKIKNPAGSICGELFKLVLDIFADITNKDQIIIQIDGEEDLSVLPLILVAPLGASVFYGQPNEGIVEVHIDEETKAKTRFLLSRFITRGY